MRGGIGKQLGLNSRSTQVQVPKFKPTQAPLKAFGQVDVDKQQDGDGDDRSFSGTARVMALRQKDGKDGSSPSVKAEPSDFEEDFEILKASEPCKGRGAAATTEAATVKAAGTDRPRPRARAPAEPKAAPAEKNPESQEGPAAAGRAVQGGSNRPSLGAHQPRSGDEIWQLNMQLGRMAEQMAEPEEAKPGRRKQKSPKLAEDLQKRWGGTYSQMLDKNFDTMEVDQPPEPKYEPPLFLEDVSVAEDTDEEGAEEPEPRPVEPARKDVAVQPQGAASTLDAGRRGSPISAGAAAAPARGRKAAGASGRSAASAAAKKAAAGAAAALTTKGRKEADAGRDTALEADGGDGESEPAQQDEEAKPGARRGGRKPKAAAAEAPSKAAPTRAATRRTVRGGGADAAALAAASGDVAAEDQGAGGDATDAPPPAAAAVAPTPAVAANFGSRIRRTHVPTSTAFGSTISKPVLPQSGSAAAAAGDCAMDDAGGGGGGEALATMTATTAKRSRDAAATADEKMRQNKAARLEQQNVELRRQLAELELKNKGLTADLAASEKRALNAEAERRREASEAAMAQREAEKARARIKERDEKVAALEDELKQVRAREARMQRQVEQWQAESWAAAQQQQQQYEKMRKGWQI